VDITYIISTLQL